jgi:hypothetical protein
MKITKDDLKKLIKEELTKEMSAPTPVQEAPMPEELSEASLKRAAGVISKVLKYHKTTIQKYYGPDAVQGLEEALEVLPKIWATI